jgi:hypothetical protein
VIWKRAADFWMLLKHGQDMAPKDYIQNDLASRISAVANKATFLEDQLQQSEAMGQQSAMEADQAKQTVEQIMMEAEGKLQEKDQLLQQVVQTYEGYKAAIANILQQAPDMSQLLAQEESMDPGAVSDAAPEGIEPEVPVA